MNFEIPEILAFSFLLISLLLCFYRLIKGPTITERIVSMDLIASVVMGFILVYSYAINNALYFDIVIVISLVSFIGTIAISTYLKQKEKNGISE